MAMTKAGMASKIEAAIALISQGGQSTDGDIGTYRTEVLEAMCEGIIAEIVANATIVTTSGSPNSEHIGNVSG